MKKWYAFFFSCFLASYAFAQSTNVSVYISGNDQAAVEGAKVSLNNSVAFTDASGMAILQNIPLGNYLLTVQAKAYANYEKRIQIGKGEQHFM